MKIERVEIIHLSIPLKHHFTTSFGTSTEKHTVLVKAYADGLVGYGETSPFYAPTYSYETIETVCYVLRDFIVPAVLNQELASADELLTRLKFIRGHNFAKAGMEIAFWDLLAQREGVPLSKLLGGTREAVPVGVSIGIQDTVGELLQRIEGFLDEGYQRIKIKIKPGWDVGVVRTVRERFPDISLMVDANSAYTLNDVDVFRELDQFNLLMIEQPLGYDDIVDHAKLQSQIEAPVCLDESIHSAEDARKAIELGSCRIINIKLGRVGGLTNVIKIHDVCQAHGLPVWAGGMLETGVGQVAKIEVASLPNFSLPGDIAPSSRLYVDDLIDPPIVLKDDGTIPVAKQAGHAYKPNKDRIEKHTLNKIVLT